MVFIEKTWKYLKNRKYKQLFLDDYWFDSKKFEHKSYLLFEICRLRYVSVLFETFLIAIWDTKHDTLPSKFQYFMIWMVFAPKINVFGENLLSNPRIFMIFSKFFLLWEARSPWLLGRYKKKLVCLLSTSRELLIALCFESTRKNPTIDSSRWKMCFSVFGTPYPILNT